MYADKEATVASTAVTVLHHEVLEAPIQAGRRQLLFIMHILP
jgi:hypothetical protein